MSASSSSDSKRFKLVCSCGDEPVNDLEEQLKCKEVTAVAMAERLKMKEDELLYLKSKVNDLEKQVQVLSKRNIFRNRIVCVSVVLFVVLLFSLGKGENVTLFHFTTIL
ncbi:topoisomerase I damage affected protein 11 [Striga asiatica]|uniref:Topoisomerase I damage affected protein 11 n=1 Tax=Striga asiatica TaxID=4170 RepID=A0A5A7RDJ6_STRAF|nr:topoisomerase I damage affected protein 11 [Striga asiatica]